MFRQALLLSIAAGILQAQESPRCTMEVTVTDRTGAPLPKATLILLRRSAGAQPQVFDSPADTAASFALKDLAPGDYSLTATAEGRSRDTSSISCPRGLVTVSIALPTEAVVSGRVTDDEGQPAPAAHVTILSRVYAAGEKRFVPAGETIAGNDGQFRLESLPEGTYYLAAVLPSGRKVAGQPWVPTFYPNALEIDAAAPIHIRGPGETGGADIRLRRERAFSIRGRLLTGDLEESARDFSIRLNTADMRTPGLRSTRAGEKGQFEFSGVLPGVYTLLARKAASTEPSARLTVTVAGSELDRVDLTLSPGLEITGTLTFNDKDQHTAPATQITLLSREAFETASSRTNGGNEFRLRSVPPPAMYRVLPPRFSHPVYAKTLRVDGNDAPDWIADLTAPHAHTLEIVLGSDGGRVTGFARDGSGNPRPNTLVTLAPAGNGPLTTPRFVTTTSDQQGRYSFAGVPPGAYQAFAWEKVEPGLVQNRQVLSQFETQCADLVVPPNGTANADATAITASATAVLE